MKESGRVSNRGSLLFETLFFVEILMGVLFFAHLKIAKEWKEQLKDLEAKQKVYDGERPWKNTILFLNN